MVVRKMTQDGDIMFGNGKSTFQKDSPEAVATVLQDRFRLNLGDWMMKKTAGLDLPIGEMSKDGIDSIIRDRITETQDVVGITSFASQLDTKTRKYTAFVTVGTTFGVIDTEVSL